MADLKIPKRGISDRFNLQDFKDDFNALNNEIAETKEELSTESSSLNNKIEETKEGLNELKTNGRVGELVVGNEALKIYQVNDNDVEMYSNLNILSFGIMNKNDTNTVGFCLEPTDISNGFQVRPYNGQYMNIGAPIYNYRINDVYAKGEIQAKSFTVMNYDTPIMEIREPYSGDLEIKSHNRFVSFLAADTNIGDGAGFCLEQTSHSRGTVRPYGGHSIDLGAYNNGFNDIYLNGFNHTYWAGYTKLPNNCIIQWGTIGFGKGSNLGEATFALAFPNFCNKVIVTPGTSESRYPVDLCYCVSGTTQYGFQMAYNKPRDEYQEFHYIAIGY